MRWWETEADFLELGKGTRENKKRRMKGFEMIKI